MTEYAILKLVFMQTTLHHGASVAKSELDGKYKCSLFKASHWK